MHQKKPITADEAIALIEKRRQRARDYYARMREDARAYRDAQADRSADVPDEHSAE